MKGLNGKKLAAALANIAPPVDAETERELIAVAFGHQDKALRTQALALVDKLLPSGKKLRQILKPGFFEASEGDACARLRGLDRDDRGQLAAALVERGANGYGVAFDEDPEFARAFLYKLLRPKKKELNLEESEHRRGQFTFVEHTTLPDVLFDELPKLRKKVAFDALSFGSLVDELPPRFIEFAPFLKKLVLRYTALQKLPEVLFECKKLEELTVIAFDIPKVPDSIGKLTELRKLTLHECKKVKELPKALLKLPKLEFLDLGFSPMRSLPDWIGDMPALREIHLQSSQVGKLPHSITRLPLKKINVRWSKLKPEIVKEILPKVTIES